MPTRARSWWGWGYADRFPDLEARRAMGEHLGALLGFGATALESPAELQSDLVPPSRAAVPGALSSLVLTDPDARARHTYGRSYRDLIRGFRGDFSNAPDAIAVPPDETSLADLLDWCSTARLSAIPFGGGTSVVSGVECPPAERGGGAIAIDLRRLTGVLEVDPVSRLARVGAGTLGPDLEAGLAPHGLTLRHYPQSFEFSTVGGWIATRAGGHFATLYTHIDDLVASIRTVTPSGVIASKTLPASGAGPSPDRLILGSEGALGVITEAVLRVRPKPRFRASATLHFTTFADGVRAARALAQSDLYPSNCRLLDPREATLHGVARESAVMIVAFESADHPLDAWLRRALDIGRDAGGTIAGSPRFSRPGESPDGEAEAWKTAFLEAPYLQSILVSLGVIVDTFETACTWSAFDALHHAIERDVRDAMQRVAGAGVLTARFTHVYPDGPAPYYTFIAPARVGSELEQWSEIKAAASEAILRHGGTITHHHAVGRTHRPWYEREVPLPFLEALRAVKRALDPEGIMNPGVLVPR